MNVRCPSCQTVFRVDPQKVPAAGVKARCSRCTTVFVLDPSGVRSQRFGQAHTAPASGVTAGSGATAPAPAHAPVFRSTGGAATAPAGSSAGTGAATAPRRVSFRNQDPEARAHRIARALVSDIVAYNKDKLGESRAGGSLRNDFREEIRKSWEEYVEQVGLELARRTPYFRDALNDILAQGQKVF